MIRSVFVFLLTCLLFSTAIAQEKKKVGRPDIPGSFVFDFGFNQTKGHPTNFKKGFWGSRTINLYYQYPIRVGRTKFSVVPGIGMSMERWKLTNKYTFNNIKNPDGTFDLVPAANLFASPTKSMIVANYFEVPLGIRFDTHPEDISKSISIAFGGRAGVLLDGFSKVKYKEDGETKINKDKQFHGLNPIRYGLYARLGVGGFNLFTYQNLSPLFEKNKGPESTTMSTWTIGISVNGF